MLFWKSFHLGDDVENYGRERERGGGEGTADNMIHAYCMLDTHGYNTHSIVARTRIIVTWHVRGLAWNIIAQQALIVWHKLWRSFDQHNLYINYGECGYGGQS
jgi:hypothetical protein